MNRLLPATACMALLLIAAGCDGDASSGLLEPGDVQWMSILPRQCGNNAWDRAGMEVGPYYEGLGVGIYGVAESLYDGGDTCASCACSNGWRIDVLIDAGDVAFMLGEGFVRASQLPES